jgi:hypothetical protein
MLKRKIQWIEGRDVLILMVITGTILVAVALGRWIALGASDWLIFVLVILVLILAIGSFTILGNWRTGLYLFPAWMIFEDLLRKYLGNNMVIYFGKDFLVGMTYLAFLFAVKNGKEKTFRPPFLALLLVFFWYGLLQAFNPLSPSLLYGLLGLKIHFYYIPLMFLGYALITSEHDLRRFLVFNLALGGVVAFLGIVQGVIGLDFLNPPTTPEHLRLYLVRQSPITGKPVPRPTSVFVSDGRFGWYMVLVFLTGLGALSYQAIRERRHDAGQGRLLSTVCLALVAVAILLTGLRGAFLWSLGSLLIFLGALLWGMPREVVARSRLWGGVQAGLFVVGVGILLAVVFFPEAMGAPWAFYAETLSPWSPTSELVYRITQYPLREFWKAFSFPNWLVGYGIGTASLGVQYIVDYFNIPRSGVGVECGYGNLVAEMGILGLLLWLAWTTALVRLAWQVVRQLRFTPLFSVGFSIFFFVFLLLFPMTYTGMQAFQNYIYNAYMWLLVGVLFRLPSLVRQEEPRLAEGVQHD